MNTYLFDFDGTLVDSIPSFGAVMLRILDENNVPYEEDILKIITPLGYTGTARYFIDLGLSMPLEQIIFLMHTYLLDAYSNHIQAKNNVVSVLKKLKKKGCCLNVLTASPHAMLDVCLKRNGMYDLFENIWSCDDFQTTKSDPEIYKMAARKLFRQPHEILFLDDNLRANETAKTAGMKTCGVYDDSSSSYEKEMKAATDYYIYDFSELLNLHLF